jgi:hypothetical protein
MSAGMDPNQPGRSQISYRADDYDFTGVRRALLRPLPGEQAIGAWRPPPGDLGLQVLEWWAYLADVLAFYNERIANESYLGTATRPDTVANLVALLGYRPAPGIAATGNVAALRSAAHPDEPLVIPVGLALSSVATPGVPAQTFEVDAAASFTGSSSVPVTLPPDTALQVGADGSPQSVLLAGRVSGIAAGDQLVLASGGFAGDDDNWALVTVGGTTAAADPGTGALNTLVSLSASVRGPAATAPLSGPVTSFRLLRPIASAALWNRGVPTSGEAVVTQNGAAVTVHLSASVGGISPGDIVLFGAPSPQIAQYALGIVTATREVLWAVPYPVVPGASPPNPPDIPIAHTALDVATADAAALPRADPATVTMRYALRDLGTIFGIPATALAGLPATVTVPSPPPPPGTTAFLQDATGAGVMVTVAGAGPGQVVLAGAGIPPAAITAPLQAPLQLLLNVLPVSRGATVTGEVLGDGNAALAGQSFTLSKSPLTYLAGGGGPVSTLAVYVGGVRWQEVPSFYGQSPDARVFVVSRSPEQTVTTVTFGDGVNGARLTSGTGNVVASYRYGSGAASPPAGRLTTILQPQPNLASIRNPVAVSGGADPQGPGDVRGAAPASVLAFGRAISAADYEAIAGQVPGVSRTAAAWTFDQTGRRPLVTIHVDGGQGAAAAASAALAGAADPNRPFAVLAANPIQLSLSCTLVVAADRQPGAVVAAATAAVSDPEAGPFSPARMGIGQLLYRSAVDAALMVPGVTAVHDLAVTDGDRVLGEVLDPGAGSYFVLPPDGVAIGAVTAGA